MAFSGVCKKAPLNFAAPAIEAFFAALVKTPLIVLVALKSAAKGQKNAAKSLFSCSEVVRVNKIYYKSILKGTPPDATSKNRMEEEFNLQEGVVVTELVEGIPLITFFVHREKDGKDHHCQTPGQEDWF
ncbi:hypothetical protein PVK06_004907 [Gossypium arboreum]|uniref:Uncharacterized protein n=1 Tax=Gossypium arboreum TaxID=29729 RepID=A0ABR0QTA7_GOSAR|nr:hypothetical protein PVK06_004907 [Gossypium arboreum]